MQHQSCHSQRACGKRWPGAHGVARHPVVLANRTAYWSNPSIRLICRSAGLETASVPVAQATNEQPPSLDFTDVTRHNFKAVLPVMRAAIQEATFVAIDAEFTGLSPDGGGEDPLDDYDERYKRLLAAADNFLICQFGLSAFKWHTAPASSSRGGGGYWEAKTFNAYIFPRTDDKMGKDKRFLCQASSLTYLAEQGFDFNKMIHEGISFVPLQTRDAKVRLLRDSLREDLANTERAREARGPEEEELVEAARGRVLSWLLGDETELLLPLPPTKRQRTLLRLLLQDEFQLPSLGYDPFSFELCLAADGGGGAAAAAGGGGAAVDLAAAAAGRGAGVDGGREEGRPCVEDGGVSDGEGSDGGGDGPEGFMRLRRLDHWRPGNLIASGQQLTPRQRIEMLVEQSGFSQVLEILRDSGRPLVGHNAVFDLAYTLSQFNGALPRNWRGYKTELQRTFPGGLYDTKHIATQLAAAGVPLGETGLGSLYRTLTDEAWLRSNVPGAGLPASLGGGVPEVRHAPGFGGYAGASAAEKAHEAGFDAFMTGAAFARLLRLMAAKAALHSGGSAAAEAAAAAAAATAAVADAAAAAHAAAASDEAASAADLLLQPLGPYRGRVHVMRSDLPYADMYGSDPVPSRPAVLYVSGFGGQTRPPFLIQRLGSLGFPPVQVCMLTGPTGAATGALVQLARADLVPKAVQAVRKKWSNWSAMTFAEYYQGRLQQQQQQQDGAGTSGAPGSGGRAPPRLIRTGPPQQRAGDGNGVQGAVEGGSARVQRLSGGAGGSGSGAEAASGSSAGAEAGEEQQRRQQSAGSGVGTERQRLQAFTQMVAEATASTAANGTLGESQRLRSNSSNSSSSRRVSAEGASDVQAGSREEDAGAASASGDAAVAAPVTASEAPAASTSTASGAGSEGVGKVGGGAAGGEAADAEAAQRAAERLRGLALAAQRLKGWPAKGEPGREAADGGKGLALQRPGRPTR
ncbi:hypothetical protein PLESTB_001241100 [Pleodorina starrii]|uniref:Uncharacterized protein n=1 Tax=Pleodorina starrii TaxID=330485 RepID=A0A9W6BSC1_9CHLO|nr:hypothetical protein PLESTM_000218700 [Pleodorina starrii]GLC57566.1 hypothetical protein PLESTB_001241100 [Pleodorina starrii]GLC63235.1 hypothetical protein PLESTF_000014800 [Pleodorina starrii]